MKYALIFALLFLSGCMSQSKIDIPIPGNGTTTLTGQAADDYARTLIQNTQTAGGRVNEMVDSLKKLLPFLFATLLIGGAFAFWTRSKYAAIIPITAAAGMGLIFFVGAWIDYIKWGMLGIVIAIVIWRGIVWQRERNAAEGIVENATGGT
jgi:hypothetical protein